MDKKDLVTNLNIAVQGHLTREEIRKGNRALEEVKASERRQEELLEEQDRKADCERRATSLEAIQPEDMLPLERAFRTADFGDDDEAFYMDTDLPEDLLQMVEDKPRGGGKYFSWVYSTEDGMLTITQKDGWYRAKGIDPVRAKARRAARLEEAAEGRRNEERERRQKAADEAAEASRVQRRDLLIYAIIAVVICMVIYAKL